MDSVLAQSRGLLCFKMHFDVWMVAHRAIPRPTYYRLRWSKYSSFMLSLYPVHTASEVRTVLEDEATRVEPESAEFWILAAALKRFVEGDGQGSLPLEVSFPTPFRTGYIRSLE